MLRLRKLALLVPLALACALVLGDAPALAAKTYPLLRTLTLPEADGGPFHDLLPNSVAVNDFTGETLVADSGTGLVQVFNSTGEYVETWTGSGTPSKSFGGGEISVAADNATGRVYVFDNKDAIVDVLGAAGQYIETWHGVNTPAGSFVAPQPLSFLEITFPDVVTVDQANGDVLVLDHENNVVDVFESTGKYLTQFKGEPEPIGPAEVAFSYGLAVDEVTGDVLVSQATVLRFGPSGAELPPLTPVTTPGKATEFGRGGDATSGSTGDIFASDENERVYIFASNDEYLQELPAGGLGVTVDHATGDIYLSSDEENNVFAYSPGNNTSAVVNVYSGAVTVPPARVEAPGVERKAGAVHVTLNGGVDPEGLPLTPTGCRFEYGTSEAYDHTISCAQSSKEIGEGFLLAHVSAELPEPRPGTTYDYRLVVENANGQNESANEAVHTPEALGVSLHAPSSLEKKGATIVATLNGSVNPEGEAVKECYFEYGAASVDEHKVPCSPAAGVLGSGSAFEPVQASIGGLSGNTHYAYRLVATNVIGLSATEGSFETPVAVTALTGCTANELLNTEATLHGSFEPEGLTTSWFFEYRKAGTLEAWSKTGEEHAATPREKILQAQGHVASLEPNTTYECQLVVSNAYGTTTGVPDKEEEEHGVGRFFTTASPPVVDGESFSAVGFSSVTLHARIDGFGARDGYRFEYGTSEAYGSSTPEVSIVNPVSGEVGVFIPVSALKPATTYYFRVVVTEPHGGGTAIGEQHAKFTTFPETNALLPDGRTYEMVSPVEAQGMNVYVPEAGNGPFPTPTMIPFQAAASGEAVAYVGAPSSGGNGSAGAGGGNEYLARLTPAGWVSRDISPPGSGSPAYLAFSSDLSAGILESREPLAKGAPGGGYDDLYARAGEGAYEPLIAERPPDRDAGEFESPGTAGPRGAGLAYAGASANLSHLLFEANDALSPEAKGEDPGKEANDLYDSVGGRLSLVNVLPASEGGAPAPDATFGAPKASGEAADPPDFSHVISQDGSRIFWTDLHAGSDEGRIYVRENGTSTVPVSAGAARFWTASTDGSYAFYTEGPENEKTLWRFDVEDDAREQLAGQGLKGESADLLGVIGVNETGEDGSYVYFVAGGELAEGATPGEPNLYLRHEGATTFIATLAPEGPEGDEGTALYATSAGSFGDWEPGLGHRTAEVTPNGHSVVFQSVRPLTGYDSENGEGRSLAEVFVYDSQAGGGLFCASCDRSGEGPPVTEVEVGGVPVKVKAAAYLPVGWSRTYIPRFISGDGGRVFFDSFEPLVAADPNNQQDVYEWERDGTEACNEGPGCDYLLSGGTSRSASYLVDASADGNDVFFVSNAKLVPSDDNESEHLYDDRVGGVLPSSPAGCTGLTCTEAPIAPPIFATPPSATFAGVGDFPPPARTVVQPKPKPRAKGCRKGFVKRKGKCVKRAKAKKAKKAGDRRGARS